AAEVAFFRLRPPRVPRRRLAGVVVVLDCPSAAGAAGASTVSGSTSGGSGARVGGATSSDFLRRKNDRGKRCLLRGALAQPYLQARGAGGREKPWHRPDPRVPGVFACFRRLRQRGGALSGGCGSPSAAGIGGPRPTARPRRTGGRTAPASP